MSDEGMSDAEFDAKVGFPVGERYVPKSKLDAAEARATAAERERDALREALDSIAVYGDDTLSGPVSEAAYRHWHRDGVRVMRDRARAALTANHSAPVVEE